MKRAAIVVIALCTLLTSTFMVASPQLVSADDPQCTDTSRPIVAIGRRRNCGYFKNNHDTSGDDVRLGGVPGYVNTAAEFIQLVEGDLNSGDPQRMTGAKFIILNMINRPAGPPQSVTPAQLQDWKDRVNAYASTSENGSSSFGASGRIDWFVSLHTPCGIVNTYYQDDEDDVGVFTDTPSNSNCEVPSYFTNFILFRDTAGNVDYMIRRECMNPVGNLEGGIDKPKVADYNLEPSIGIEVNGDSSMNTAEVGDSVRFVYQATNSGPDPSPSATCTIYANVHSGYFPTPPTPTSGNNPAGYVPPPTSCPKVFPGGLSPIATETITITAPNQTVCRSLFVSPASPTVGSRGKEACVPITNKPYTRVWGGDVSVGSGFADASGVCTDNPDAAIVGWNKRAAGSYAGAGTQYASFALARIMDFSSALYDPGGASAPEGLSFANTASNATSGDFGGGFGDASCIPDYYGSRPDAPSPLPANITAMVTDTYGADSDTYFSNGNNIIAPGERIIVYVDGDVHLNANVRYEGSWGTDSIPNFQLIARGNIYIDSAAVQLDGLYVAQPREDGTGGAIYDCISGLYTEAPLDGTLNARCRTKLTVNGAFVAKSVHLMRTVGTLQQSAQAELSTSANVAEAFNYGPAFWIPQPVPTGSTPDYDAIISLPPIL